MNQQEEQEQQEEQNILPEYLIQEKRMLNTSYSSQNDLSFSSHVQNALKEDTKCSVQLNDTTSQINDYQKQIQHLNNLLSKSGNKNDSLRKQIKELNLQINRIQEQSLSQQTTQLMGQAMRIIQVENAALKEELNLYKIKPIEKQLIDLIQNCNTQQIERIQFILEQQFRLKGIQTELQKREVILIKQIKQIDQLQKTKSELEQSFYLASCKLEHKRAKANNFKIENKLLKNYIDHFHLKTSTDIINIFDSNNNIEVFEQNFNHSRIEPQISLKLQQNRDNRDEVLSQRNSVEDPTIPLKKKIQEQDQILQQFYHKQEQLQNEIELHLKQIKNLKEQVEQYDVKQIELESQIIQLQTTLSEQNESCNKLICDLKAKLDKKQIVQSMNTQKTNFLKNHMVNSNFEPSKKSTLFKKQTSFDQQFAKKQSISYFGKTEQDLSESIDLKYILPQEASHTKIQSKIGELQSKLNSLSQSMSKSTQNQGNYLQSKKTSIFIDFNYK